MRMWLLLKALFFVLLFYSLKVQAVHSQIFNVATSESVTISHIQTLLNVFPNHIIYFYLGEKDLYKIENLSHIHFKKRWRIRLIKGNSIVFDKNVMLQTELSKIGFYEHYIYGEEKILVIDAEYYSQHISHKMIFDSSEQESEYLKAILSTAVLTPQRCLNLFLSK